MLAGSVSEGVKHHPKRCCWDDLGCGRAGDVSSKPLYKEGPRPSPTDLGVQFQHDIPEFWRNFSFFTPLWHNWPPCPLCYLSSEWPIISGEKWGENSFFRRIRKCQGSLPTSGCYTPVIAFCYCKGFPRRDCLLSCASALRCIFTTRTDLASLFFPKFYDNKSATQWMWPLLMPVPFPKH